LNLHHKKIDWYFSLNQFTKPSVETEEPIWTSNDVSQLAVEDDLLSFVTTSGILFCLHIPTGKLIWKEELEFPSPTKIRQHLATKTHLLTVTLTQYFVHNRFTGTTLTCQEFDYDKHLFLNGDMLLTTVTNQLQILDIFSQTIIGITPDGNRLIPKVSDIKFATQKETIIALIHATSISYKPDSITVLATTGKLMWHKKLIQGSSNHNQLAKPLCIQLASLGINEQDTISFFDDFGFFYYFNANTGALAKKIEVGRLHLDRRRYYKEYVSQFYTKGKVLLGRTDFTQNLSTDQYIVYDLDNSKQIFQFESVAKPVIIDETMLTLDKWEQEHQTAIRLKRIHPNQQREQIYPAILNTKHFDQAKKMMLSKNHLVFQHEEMLDIKNSQLYQNQTTGNIDEEIVESAKNYARKISGFIHFDMFTSINLQQVFKEYR
jgi:outer membrane protein assembly factor BamB